MKTASSGLLSLLAGSQYVSADLWTITLAGGTIIRWTSADVPIINSGNTFALGPAITRGQISEKRGVSVAMLEVHILDIGSTLVNGKPLIAFITGHGLDGASIKLERGFAPNWLAASTGTGCTGSLIRFAGKVTSISSIQGEEAVLTVSSWMVLLNSDMPRNLYQAGCLHTLYDSGCTLLATNFRTSTSVNTTTGTTTTMYTALAPALNYYAQGRVVFTSGPNNGLSRTVRSSDTAGGFVLVNPLPFAPANGDTFDAYAGCDLVQSTCSSKFNNLVHFKATPYVPLIQTSVGSATTTTTTSGKG